MKIFLVIGGFWFIIVVMKINPETLIDGYKTGHRKQLAPNLTLSFGNMTPRKSYRTDIPEDGIVWIGLQYFLKEYLLKQWNENFFQLPKEKVISRFQRRINNYLGPNNVGIDHIEALHDLGYLPLAFYALPEGVSVPYKVAPFVYWTTDERFGWLQAYIETILSTTVWPLSTTATTAKQIRTLLERFAMETVGNTDFVKFQGHNFSYRGCVGHEAAVIIDAGFITSFAGSDTVPGVDFIEEYYNGDSDKELISCSVNASEHAVVSSYGGKELEALRHLITNVYPTGIFSYISDTTDYWKTLSEFAVELKDTILSRDGKLVFRPDSGDNTKIIIGDPDAPEGSPERKGTIELLWDIFGGKVNDKGYKELDSHVGAILGDGVTWKVLNNICDGLKAKGFASTNMVYGVGSYYLVFGISRDTDGWAVKSTYVVVDGEEREIFKNPKTDTGNLKKSAKGLIAVYQDINGVYYQKDQVSWDDVKNCSYEKVFENGTLFVDHTFSEIRNRIHKKF
jgi:nicotinamide phosphoribosyltransferase